MLLSEIFDKQFDIKWIKDFSGTNIAIVDKLNLEVYLSNFSYEEDGYTVNIEFSVDDTFGKTNNNKNQFLIFSAVYQVIKEYLTKNNDIVAIKFSSDGENRTALYKKFIEKYASKFGFKLVKNTTEQWSNNTKFYLRKIR